MNIKNHIPPDDLQRLLFGESSDQQVREIAEHVEECTACQKSLDEMAATREVWDKAADLITPQFLSETIAIGSEHDEIRPDSESLPWDYPIEKLFDRPSHPEMLGRLGKYEIEREVGRGGMGVVLKAFDSELNRPVAIKILAPHLAASGAARKRFAREARAAAAVLHPNVIAIHGVDATEKEVPFIVMPYVDGPSLQKMVDQDGPLELKDIVRIAMQIAAGLTAAHSQGLIHRDIKPANILIESGVSRVLITDFGLARAEDDASMTHTGWLAGTPNFMSPEQAHGRRLDGRSDLFSLGSVIYFMSTGRLPYRADSPVAVLTRICNEQPTPVRQVNSDVSKTLSEIIDKLLEKDPADRFQSAGELHQVLEQYLAYLHQPDISRPPKIRKSNSRKPLLAFGAIAAAMLAGFLLVWNAVGQGWLGPAETPAPGAVNSTFAAEENGALMAEPSEHRAMIEHELFESTEAAFDNELKTLIERHALETEEYISRQLLEMDIELQAIEFGLDQLGPIQVDR